jgi:ferredoxin, 2Fe-2S
VIHLKFVQEDGVCQFVETPLGTSLMEAARRARVVGIEAACGGSLACGTCHVHIPEPWFSRLEPPGEIETEMLEYGIHVQSISRLSCQIPLSDSLNGMEVRVPTSQR